MSRWYALLLLRRRPPGEARAFKEAGGQAGRPAGRGGWGWKEAREYMTQYWEPGRRHSSRMGKPAKEEPEKARKERAMIGRLYCVSSTYVPVPFTGRKEKRARGNYYQDYYFFSIKIAFIFFSLHFFLFFFFPFDLRSVILV